MEAVFKWLFPPKPSSKISGKPTQYRLIEEMEELHDYYKETQLFTT